MDLLWLSPVFLLMSFFFWRIQFGIPLCICLSHDFICDMTLSVMTDICEEHGLVIFVECPPIWVCLKVNIFDFIYCSLGLSPWTGLSAPSEWASSFDWFADVPRPPLEWLAHVLSHYLLSEWIRRWTSQPSSTCDTWVWEKSRAEQLGTGRALVDSWVAWALRPLPTFRFCDFYNSVVIYELKFIKFYRW